MQLPEFLRRDRYGYVYLAGHRVGLNHVVDAYREMGSVEAVAGHFPTLTRVEVARTVEFYQQNQAEIDVLLTSQEDQLGRRAENERSGPSREELRRRMEARELAEKAS